MEIKHNRANNAGGGIYAFASVIEIVDCYCYNNQICMTHISHNQANNGGGAYLTASSVRLLQSLITIENKIASQYGGGIYIEENSKMISYAVNLNGRSTLHFVLNITSNKALRGGGVYVSDSTNELICEGIHSLRSSEVNLSSKQCFFQSILFVPQSNYFLSITFSNNSATETGSDIYGGLLDRCTISPLAQIVPANHEYKINGILYLQGIGGFDWAQTKVVSRVPCLGNVTHGVVTNVSEFYNHISSDPVRTCFCVNNASNCSYIHPTIYKKKGVRFTLNIVAVDQVGIPVNAKLISSLHSENKGIGTRRLKEGQQHRDIEGHCTELEYNVFSYESSAVLELYADGPCANQGISKKNVNITFILCTCPIGLEENVEDPIDCSCVCATKLKPFINNCSQENETIQINSNVWIESISCSNSTTCLDDTNSTFCYVTHDCPFDYCLPKPAIIRLNDSDTQCDFDRTGRLCGECPQGLSLVFASSRCQQCSNYSLFLLLPFTLAGIALVVFIMLLNMTVATGTIHGLIFYANILAANRSIFLPFNKPNFLTVFISWLNLDLGIETCFYDGMNSYEKVLLQIVFPAYLFFLIIVIMVLCNCFQRIAHLLSKRNTEATLYTLTLLSYSKLVRIIISALQFAVMNYSEGERIFWLYDANVPYFRASHVPRFLVAFFIIILGSIYTTLLLFGQLFNFFSEHRVMKWATNIHYIHFMKAHHAPFSDKHRYWVGLLLLARLVHYLISAFSNNSIIVLSVSTMTVLLLFHKLACKHIYSAWSVDLLETVFMLNLTILSTSTFFVRETSHSSDNQKVLALVSMSTSFIVFLGIVLYHMLDTCGVKSSKLSQVVLAVLRKRQHYLPIPITEIDGDMTDESDPAHYVNPIIIRSAMPADQLREPALDVLTPVQPEDYNTPATPTLRREKLTFSEIEISS